MSLQSEVFGNFYCEHNIQLCVRNNLNELQKNWRASKHWHNPDLKKKNNSTCQALNLQ